MKNRIGLNSKIWKIMLAALFTLMLSSTIAFAKIDVQVNQQNDDSVSFVVENSGTGPVYVLNMLLILDNKGKTVYASQDLSSSELLKINSGVSYTFDWIPDDAGTGTYTGKIFSGDEKTLSATLTKFELKPRSGKPRFYTNKISYKLGQNVDVTFRNNGLGTIYANVNNWKITNLDTGKVVNTLSLDCSFGYGYGSCGNLFEPLKFMQKVKQTWDQKDSSGNQVVPGRYQVTAEYSNNLSGSDSKTISTKTFFIRPSRSTGKD
jgi:hypothetical protein